MLPQCVQPTAVHVVARESPAFVNTFDASNAPARVEHHAQDAIDAEPGVPETGVGVAAHARFTFGALVRAPASEFAAWSLLAAAKKSSDAAMLGNARRGMMYPDAP